MNILVTGSGGYIGTYLLKRVRKAFPEASVQPCDVKQGLDYRTIYGKVYDVVFHLAAISTIMDSFARADEMMANNALDLIPFFQDNVVEKFIFSSTGAIYGEMTKPKREDEAKWIDCLCPYAHSKYVAEGIIRHMCPTHMIARFGNVFGGDYGPREEWLAPTHFMYDNPIILYGGTQIRDFVPLDVVCNALIDAAKRPITGTFNIANGVGVELKKVAELFSFKRAVPIVYAEHRQGDAKYVVLDVTKARNAGLIPKEPPVNDYNA